MTTKEILLDFLERNQGKYISGQEIAEQLQLSRTSVWKAVKALQQQGYPIQAVSNKGYCLLEESDIFSVQGVQRYLSPLCANFPIELLPVVSSTNTLLKEKAHDGTVHGSVLMASQQTGGKGRLGRRFFSPKDSGIYISLLLRPTGYFLQHPSLLTCVAGVALCNAIHKVCQKSAQIKWVNDIFLEGKKVCGVLTEASFSLENGQLDYVVVGAGINVYPPKEGFPAELQEVAGALLEHPIGNCKNQLAASFLNFFMEYYNKYQPHQIMEQYRNLSCVIGREVLVVCPHTSYKAKVLDILSNGELLVQQEDGSTQTLSSGEISLRF